jgi:hypothetical protein
MFALTNNLFNSSWYTNLTDDDGTDDDMDIDTGMFELEIEAYTALFVIAGFLPIMIVVVLPIWERHKNKRRSADEAERRLISTTLAQPIRQTYLVDLMKDYSMVSTVYVIVLVVIQPRRTQFDDRFHSSCFILTRHSYGILSVRSCLFRFFPNPILMATMIPRKRMDHAMGQQ